MAESDGEVALKDPEALISEIERTRESLARTIDALADRVSPGAIARRATSRVREQLARRDVQAIGGAVALVSVAAVAYMIWRRRK